MADLTDIARQVGELRRQIRDVQTENRINSGTLATAIRKTRQQVDAAALNDSIHRGRTSTAAKLWDPRAGDFVQPDLATSLISRLKRGDPVANTLGEAQAGGIGLRNFFTDSRLTSVATTSLLDTLLHTVSRDWDGRLTSTIGLGFCTVDRTFSQSDPIANPLATATMSTRHRQWTAAGTATVVLRSFFTTPDFDATVLPFAVFSATIFKSAQSFYVPSTATSIIVKLQVRDATDTTTIIESAPLDFLAMDIGSYYRLWAPFDSAVWDAANVVVRVVITTVTSGTSGGLGDFEVSVGNPQMELAPYQYPTAYMMEPLSGQATIYLDSSDYGVELKRFNDGNPDNGTYRLHLGIDNTGKGRLVFQGGVGDTAGSVRLQRSASSVLRFDDGAFTPARVTFESYAGVGPGTPGAGLGRLYYSSVDKHWHQVDDAGLDTDLAGAGAGLTGGVPALTFSTANAAGVAATGIRTDATLAIFDATVPVTQAFGDAAATGAAAFAARRDHKHGMPAAPTQVSRDATAAAADYVARVRLSTDTTYRGFLGLTAADEGSLELGGGGVGARDVRAYRRAAGQLGIDAIGAAVQTYLQLRSTAGQRSLLGLGVTGDTADRTSVYGDATVAGILLGSGAAGADVRGYRSGAKVWTFDDSSAGAITVNTVGTLQQGGTNVSLLGHGAADHADITRNVFIQATHMAGDGATSVGIGATANIIRAQRFADAATSGVVFSFQVPDNWASGVLTLQPVWSPGASDAAAHTVRWSMTCKNVVAGTTVTAAGTTVTFTGASAARTIGVAVFDTATSTGVTPAAAKDLFQVELQRIGADAADTYLGTVDLLGVIISYTANQ